MYPALIQIFFKRGRKYPAELEIKNKKIKVGGKDEINYSPGAQNYRIGSYLGQEGLFIVGSEFNPHLSFRATTKSGIVNLIPDFIHSFPNLVKYLPIIPDSELAIPGVFWVYNGYSEVARVEIESVGKDHSVRKFTVQVDRESGHFSFVEGETVKNKIKINRQSINFFGQILRKEGYKVFQ